MNHSAVKSPVTTSLKASVSEWLAEQAPTAARAPASAWVASIIDDFSAPPRVTVVGRPGMPCAALVSALIDDMGGAASGAKATIRTAELTQVPANADLVLVLCPYISAVEQALRALPMPVEVLVLPGGGVPAELVVIARRAIETLDLSTGGAAQHGRTSRTRREAQLRRRLEQVACAFPELRDELEGLLWPTN